MHFLELTLLGADWMLELLWVGTDWGLDERFGAASCDFDCVCGLGDKLVE